MQFLIVGISHKQAPIEIRERIAFTFSKRINAMKELTLKGIEEVVILSTCNRCEIIIATKRIENSINITKQYLNDYAEIDLNQYLYLYKQEAAIKHIYKVACGLDSIVIGEDQILGQVKEALETAQEVDTGKKYLSKLIREAITFSKSVRATYSFSENPLSISSIGVKYIKNYVGSLKSKKVMIIGTGKMGSLVLKYLLEEKVEKIYISNRTHSKMNCILERHENVQGILYENRYDVLSEMDILITSTSSPHIVIKKELMPRRDKPLIILDLAVPRDVDPSLSECEQVDLFTVDDLQDIVDENLQFRYTIAEIINQKINLEVEKMMNWLLQSKVDPAIECICTWQEQFIKETLTLLSRDKTLALSDKAYIEELMGTSLKRIMRKPIKRLKTLNEPEKIEEYNKIIHHLFDTTKETTSISNEIPAVK